VTLASPFYAALVMRVAVVGWIPKK